MVKCSELSVVLVALLSCIIGCKAQAPSAMFVQSGEHFNEVVAETDGSGKVARNTVLVLQEASCPLRVTWLTFASTVDNVMHGQDDDDEFIDIHAL